LITKVFKAFVFWRGNNKGNNNSFAQVDIILRRYNLIKHFQ
jgi:hypothetical protein